MPVPTSIAKDSKKSEQNLVSYINHTKLISVSTNTVLLEHRHAPFTSIFSQGSLGPQKLNGCDRDNMAHKA